jgi:N-ATPase, AtpR subunit
MSPPLYSERLLLMASAGASGIIFGWGYFELLRRWVAGFVMPGTKPRKGALALMRIAAALAFFTLAAHFGAPALLSSFAGFLLARTLALRARGNRP